MIFNEIYGCYYNAVAKMIQLAIEDKLTEKEMYRIASEEAYDESVLAIIPAVKQQEWQLIKDDLSTPIKHKPTMPLTELERRWLKTILLDPRIAVFMVPTTELDDVEPLFYPSDIVYFDRYLDGDKYTHPSYIANFQLVMQAIREHRKIRIHFRNNHNKERYGIFYPLRMEYSDKEDKFRILSQGSRDLRTVNMGRIIKCELLDEYFEPVLTFPERKKGTLIFELTNTRNTLERAMMKFAHYKKQAERTGENTYLIELEYDKEDETDVLIQIMSFGSAVKVLEPISIQEEMKLRLEKQVALLQW